MYQKRLFGDIKEEQRYVNKVKSMTSFFPLRYKVRNPYSYKQNRKKK